MKLRGVDIEKEGTEVSIPPNSEQGEGCWGNMGTLASPVCHGVSKKNPGLRRGSGRGSGAGRLGARWKVRGIAMTASTWPPSPGAHSSLSSVLCRSWVTGLYISTIQQEGPTQRRSVSLRERKE